jgi:hypothetical protein
MYVYICICIHIPPGLNTVVKIWHCNARHYVCNSAVQGRKDGCYSALNVLKLPGLFNKPQIAGLKV